MSVQHIRDLSRLGKILRKSLQTMNGDHHVLKVTIIRELKNADLNGSFFFMQIFFFKDPERHLRRW